MDADLTALPVTRLAKLEPRPKGQGWLIEDLWAAGAVGCIGGTPKAGKTWLALEMAIAVASGRPCLGRYTVHSPGPVLIFCAEDGPDEIRARAEGLARARGLDFARLAVGWIGATTLHLDDPTHQRRLHMTLAEVKPRMLILDPLVRLHRGDENSAGDVSDLLGYLRGLQRDYDVAVVLVHHVRKSAASEPGQSLRGSGDLHAWGDSNLYLLKQKGQPTLFAEHRAHRAPAPVVVRLEEDPPRLVVRDTAADQAGAEEASGDQLDRKILAALAASPLTRGELRKRVGVRNETLGAAVERLIAAGRVQKLEDGLAVPVPVPVISRDQRERNEP